MALIKAQQQPRPTSRPQEVSQPAKNARKVQKKSGVLAGQTHGGAAMQLTQRNDKRVYYQQLKALAQQSQRSSTPDRQMVYDAAHARLRFNSREEAANLKLPADLFPSSPLVGHNPMLTDGGSATFTQVRASLQYWHRTSPAYSQQVNDPNSPLGPVPKRAPIPYQGTNLNIRTLIKPHGYTPVRQVKPSHASMTFKPSASVLVKHKLQPSTGG